MCYVTTDHLGSTRLVTGEPAQATDPVLAKERYDYLPFGDEVPTDQNGRSAIEGYGVSGTRLKFTGKERDQTETGLDFFGARYMSSAQGRFTSPDWSAKPLPVPYADLSDPQTLNLYAYVRNNPLSRRDLDGHADVVALCKGQSTCNVTVRQTVNLTNNGKTYSTIGIDTKFTVTTDAKGKVSVAAASTASNIAGQKLTDGQLSIIGATSSDVQRMGATMGLGSNTTQLLTAIAGQESKWGSAPKPASEPDRKDPFINPLQLSGGRATLDYLQNVQGGLDVLQWAGRPSKYDPAATYKRFGPPEDEAQSAFQEFYGNVNEAVDKK